jgi:wyosine [tRNA(Phe)-imidazoG37] synthetase (radical SAM superfamily)
MVLDFPSATAGLRGFLRPFTRAVAAVPGFNPARPLKFALLRAAMERFPERKLFCPMPFKMIEIERGGGSNLCCWLPRSPGRLDEKGLMTLWNSPGAQEIRASILDGTFRYCDLDRCPYFVSGSLPLQKNAIYGPYGEIIRKGITRLDTARVFLAMDPRCNLRCISCRKDYVQISENERADVQRLLELVKRDLSSITAIGLSGSGDPFVSPETRDLLFNHDSARYPQLRIYLLTNGQLFNRACWGQMGNVQEAIASVQVSVDAATRKTYERIRLGGSFSNLMENLRFLSELRQRGTIGEFIISFVVNALNFREMKAFARMGFELGCDQVAFSYMSNWCTFSEDEYREMALHMPGHKDHSALKEILGDPLFLDPRVFLHNLSGLRAGRIMSDSLFV